MHANPPQRQSARLTETTSPDLEDDMTGRGTAKTVDELLAQARAMLPHRPSPAEALQRKPAALCWSTSAATTSGATRS
jgi:hypothetical protein